MIRTKKTKAFSGRIKRLFFFLISFNTKLKILKYLGIYVIMIVFKNYETIIKFWNIVPSEIIHGLVKCKTIVSF